MPDFLPPHLPNAPRPPITDAASRGPLDRTARLSMRTRTYTARTIAECLQMAKQELGVEAMIVSKRTFRKGALFGRWGGREMVEVTFGTYRPTPAGGSGAPASIVYNPVTPAPPSAPEAGASEPVVSSMQKLEAQLSSLTESVQNLMENGASGKALKPSNAASPFMTTPIEARLLGAASPSPVETREFGSAPEPAAAPPKTPRAPRRTKKPVAEAGEPEAAGPYPTLMRQLLDAEVAAPLARQLLEEVPGGLSTVDAAAALRTAISQRLRIANRVRPEPGAGMRLLAFMGTTGVGKTTTVAKLAAQYAIVERRRVGIVTLDTHRIAAAQQLQTYGQILKVPVLVAHEKTELMKHLSDFKAQQIELVLIDTAGRSPNDMVPLGDTADLFENMGAVRKYLALPATMSARDMENIVTRFQSLLAPDALILTKLDEATDNSCFGKVLTIQAKYGLPLAYVTTGQKVPDDITFPDAHAIAARILTTALL